MHHFSCSKPLQRVLVDFGADNSFAKACQKVKEHYGVEISASTVRKQTETHAKQMYQQAQEPLEIPQRAGFKQQIAEMDACMLPIMTADENAPDKRKKKKLHWKAATLALAHKKGSVTPKFGAVFQGDVADAGRCLRNSAILAGFGQQTRLHAVGDGATWIAKQFELQFGERGSYLVDFYHVCEYLAAASPHCVSDSKLAKAWVEQQKQALKNNEYTKVIAALKPYLEAEDIVDKQAPVRACHRYLSNRTEQLDYKTAIEQELPIGSGEIESAHRYVIQKRMKLPGAWWKSENVDSMLALRVLRANEQWDAYWAAA